MFFIAKSKKQMADVPMICTIFDEFWLFHSPKWEKKPFVKKGYHCNG